MYFSLGPVLVNDKISMPLMSVSKDIKLSYEDADRIMNQLLNCMHPEDANQLIYMLWHNVRPNIEYLLDRHGITDQMKLKECEFEILKQRYLNEDRTFSFKLINGQIEEFKKEIIREKDFITEKEMEI